MDSWNDIKYHWLAHKRCILVVLMDTVDLSWKAMRFNCDDDDLASRRCHDDADMYCTNLQVEVDESVLLV